MVEGGGEKGGGRCSQNKKKQLNGRYTIVLISYCFNHLCYI